MWLYKDYSFYDQKLYYNIYKKSNKDFRNNYWYSINSNLLAIYDDETIGYMGRIGSYSAFVFSLDASPKYFYNVPELLHFLYVHNFNRDFIKIFENLYILPPNIFIDNIVDFYNIKNVDEIYRTFCQLICPEKILVDERLAILAFGLWLLGLKNNKGCLRFMKSKTIYYN